MHSPIDVAAPFREPLNFLSCPPDKVEEIEGASIPEPYRSLLVHESDMTSVLERYYGSRLQVHPLKVTISGAVMQRDVILLTADGRTAEFGAIRVYLDALPDLAREEVMAAKKPFGAILTSHAIAFRSKPERFFSAHLHPSLWERVGDKRDVPHYGRRNRLFNDEATLAEVVEILPYLSA